MLWLDVCCELTNIAVKKIRKMRLTVIRARMENDNTRFLLQDLCSGRRIILKSGLKKICVRQIAPN